VTNFELKFKNSSGLEFDLNLKKFMNFDFMQSLIKVIRVPMKCLNLGMLEWPLIKVGSCG
jgi:hypothetical protein